MVLVLSVISAVSALLVGLVHNMTKEAVAAADEQSKNKAKFAVLSTTESEAMVLRDTTRNIGDFDVTVSTIVSRADNNVIGYAVEAPSLTANGYSDRIYLMVGFKEQTDSNGASGVVVNGVEVLSQKETPGLGANMTKPGNSLEKSVVGKNPETLIFKVKKDDAKGSFDALTGSTISSRAYANACETAYAAYLWNLGKIAVAEEVADAEIENLTDEAESETQEGVECNE